jgi:hypothetical protein
MKTRLYLIGAMLSIALTAHSFACDNRLINKHSTKTVGAQLSSYFPEKFSGDQIQALQSGKLTDVPHGNVGMDEENRKKLIATTPYKFQVLTGSWEKFAGNIKILPGSEQYVNPDQLRATYRFQSPWMTRNNADFDVILNLESVIILPVTDSILGNNDFMLKHENEISISSFLYIANTDEQFIRDTPSALHRFNGPMSSWLLILAQLDGEDVYSLSDDARLKRGEELFTVYLQKKKLTLDAQQSLTQEEYILINNELRTAILEHLNLSLTDIPTLEHIMEAGGSENLANRKIYIEIKKEPNLSEAQSLDSHRTEDLIKL